MVAAARLIVPAGQPRLRSGDSHYPFRPDSNYAWLTGDQTPGGVLVLEPAGGEPRPWPFE